MVVLSIVGELKLVLIIVKKIADITLNIGANFALAKNEIIEQMEEPRMYDNLITTGKPLKQTYGMEVIGYFKDQADIENSPKQSFGDVKSW